MELLFYLKTILSEFRHLFNAQNFSLFQAFIIGLMTHTDGGVLTHLYQASTSQTRYWSFPKFLSPREMGFRCPRGTPHQTYTAGL